MLMNSNRVSQTEISLLVQFPFYNLPKGIYTYIESLIILMIMRLDIFEFPTFFIYYAKPWHNTLYHIRNISFYLISEFR